MLMNVSLLSLLHERLKPLKDHGHDVFGRENVVRSMAKAKLSGRGADTETIDRGRKTDAPQIPKGKRLMIAGRSSVELAWRVVRGNLS